MPMNQYLPCMALQALFMDQGLQSDPVQWDREKFWAFPEATGRIISIGQPLGREGLDSVETHQLRGRHWDACSDVTSAASQREISQREQDRGCP